MTPGEGIVNYFQEADFYLVGAGALLVDLVARRWLSQRLRVVLLTLISIGMLGLLQDAEHLLPVVGSYTLLVAGASWSIVRRPPSVWASATAMVTIFMVVLVLLVTRHPGYLEWFVGWQLELMQIGALPWLGVSYLTFRAVDLVLTVKSGGDKQLRVLDAVLYLVFFVPFISGPIVRFRAFSQDLTATAQPLTVACIRAQLERIAVGTIKMLLLSKIAFAGSVLARDFAEGGLTPLRLALGLYAFYAYIYLEFSGYCDCAIAIARLFGIRLPENFNWPFLAMSVQDFWNRWHISLSHWCRDHIFFPMMMKLSSGFPDVPRLVWLCVSIFITFVLVGMWHGDASHWFWYGCLHGAGLSITALYDHLMRAHATELFERFQAHRLYRIACQLATFHFVAFGLLLAIPHDKAGALLSAAFGSAP